jgi:hypothetical protein
MPILMRFVLDCSMAISCGGCFWAMGFIAKRDCG